MDGAASNLLRSETVRDAVQNLLLPRDCRMLAAAVEGNVMSTTNCSSCLPSINISILNVPSLCEAALIMA